MSFLEQQKFEFVSSAPGLSHDSFGVVKFKGVEAISMPYEFDVTLVSDNRDVTPEAVLPYSARFTISRDKGGGDVHFNGILAEFEEIREFGGYIFYRAHLVPKLWWLNLTYHNQVCLDNGVDEILENCLKDGGLFPGRDFEIRLRRKAPKFDYVCQYGETHFNFISRWVEREGIYYFFEQTPDGEKIIFTDTLLAHTDLLQGANLTYAPPSGLESSRIDEAILSFTCRRRMLPKKVFLKDYNYEKPSLGIEGSAVVDQNGRGENYHYGEHFPSPEEGDRLAKIIAEALLCRQSCFYGESSVPFMRPGYRFQLNDHYRAQYNRKYLISEVTHEGHQTGYLISGIRAALAATEEKMAYGNQFTAIYSDLQFRPERKAAKPKIPGTLHANVDAEGAGEYAELDDQGRYKIRLPFDVSKDHPDGKASAYIRMMQPYAGSVEGMHFPLRKGAEVLLTFIGGDPDRPVIAGAVPNPNTASPVTSTNQTESVIKTGSNNQIRMEDLAGSQRIIMETPTADTWFRMGAPNDPPPPAAAAAIQTVKDYDATKGIKIFTTGTLVEESQDDQKVYLNDPTFAQRDGSSNAYRKREVTVDGEQVSTTKKSYKISAEQDTLKITMDDEGITLDAGDKNIKIDCNHFQVNNSKEDNITSGDDFEEHHGSATEIFHGTKNEVHYGSLHSAHFGGAAEAFIGGKAEFSLAEAFEIFLGLKQEISLAANLGLSLAENFEFNFGAKQEINISPLFDFALNIGIKIELLLGLKIGYTLAALDKTEVNMLEEEVKVEGGKLLVGGKKIAIENNAFKMIA